MSATVTERAGDTNAAARRAAPPPPAGDPAGDLSLRAVLLACGIYAALLYATMLVFVPVTWTGYSSAAQTISELSALGAPTRGVWVTLGLVHAVLTVGFGWGVRMSGGRGSRLRTAGTLIIAAGAMGPFWPPMHMRGAETTLTDTLHIAVAIAWNVLAVLAIVFAAAARGRRLRLYSALTLLVFVVFGTLTGLDGPRVAANLPTPWVGVWERILVAAWLLWTLVLSVALLRTRVQPPPAPRARIAVPRIAGTAETMQDSALPAATAGAGGSTPRAGSAP